MELRRVRIEMYGKAQIHLYVGTEEEIQKEVERITKEPYTEEFRGLAFGMEPKRRGTGRQYFIGINNEYTLNEQINTLNHECLHFCMDTFNTVGVLPDYNNQEVVTYFVSNVFGKLLDKLTEMNNAD